MAFHSRGTPTLGHDLSPPQSHEMSGSQAAAITKYRRSPKGASPKTDDPGTSKKVVSLHKISEKVKTTHDVPVRSGVPAEQYRRVTPSTTGDHAPSPPRTDMHSCHGSVTVQQTHAMKNHDLAAFVKLDPSSVRGGKANSNRSGAGKFLISDLFSPKSL